MPHTHGQRLRLISPACAVVRQTAFTARTASAIITYNLSRLLQRVASDLTMRFLNDAVISIENNESVPSPQCVADMQASTRPTEIAEDKVQVRGMLILATGLCACYNVYQREYTSGRRTSKHRT